MQTLKVILSLVAGLILVSAAQAQTADWRVVEHLAPGSRISVKIRFRVLCDLQRATETVLVCEPIRHSSFLGQSQLRFERKRIREVRLEHSDQTNAAIGAAVGGGVGATVGTSLGNPPLNREGGALLMGGIGAIAGGFFGRDFPLIHGKVIYKR